MWKNVLSKKTTENVLIIMTTDIGRKRSSFSGLPTNSRCVHKIPYCWKEQHRGTWCLALSLQLQRYLVYGTGRSSVVEPVIFWPAQAPIFFNWSQLRLFRPAPAPTLTRDPYKNFFPSFKWFTHQLTRRKIHVAIYRFSCHYTKVIYFVLIVKR